MVETAPRSRVIVPTPRVIHIRPPLPHLGAVSFDEHLKQAFLEGRDDEEDVVLSDAGLDAIRTELKAHLDSADLLDHAKTLLRVASRLERVHESPTAAARLRGLLEERQVLQAIRSMKLEQRASERDEIAATARAFASFVEPKRHGSENEGTSEDTKSAVTLDFFNLPLRA